MLRITSRSLLLGFASAATLLACPLVASAQSAPPQDDASQVDEIVVTGTRTVGRSRLDTIAPVDVISAQTLTRTGTGTETAAALANAAPSINFPRPAISDGSDHVRPASLRGLAPDQTLVLINGQRGHVSALVNVNGSLGRGSTAFDLNTIPSVALGSVEVLRDGASAQYGSDAIAGVLNLRLREADSGGGLTYNYGRFDTTFTTARGDHKAEDGEQQSLAGWIGLPLGDDGFITFAGELQTRDPTNRSDYAAPSAVNGGASNQVIGRFGDPDVQSQSLWFNAGKPLSNDWTAYAFGGVQHKASSSAATARAFNETRNDITIYPNGFLPLIETEIVDKNIYGGIKGPAFGIDWDLSAGYGSNALDYRVVNSLNRTYGTTSQREFDAGGLSYDQFTVGIDGVKPLDIGLYEPLNFAFGVEYRAENFEVTAGEPASYNQGPQIVIPGTTTANPLGSQGFPGLSNKNAIKVDRSNYSAFVDFEGKLTEAFSFGLAARYEDYSDFGDTLTGKASARYDFTPGFAIRGAVSSGFHAPALQQQYFSYTATNLSASVVGGVPVVTLAENSTFRVDDPVSRILGSKPLEAETSVNYSLGLVFRLGAVDLTVDAYQIDVNDRIAYSETLGGTGGARPGQTVAERDAIRAFLTANLPGTSVSGVRFFVNGVDTTTKGIDVVGRYRLPTDYGRFDFTVAGNYNDTKVNSTPPSTSALASSPFFLFDRANILAFEDGTPEKKVVSSLDWSLGGWSATAKATYYDSVLIANNSPSLDYETGSDTLIDLEARYELPIGVGLAVGVTNLTDEYPQFTPAAINGSTGSTGFPQYSPYGFNGRFVYGRVSYNF
ncbi:TonB-dependent receptor plug domain-containing protein [Brevundimonas subvibrioides]|uniref:TonB-dependent receptor plug domain-containing protein n=1 Tax=Brevundimonas subvibrioides TaxID=74313 RepID=UPI0022B57603|nr:TonB-dependent receptor [Brevundimonas subvibrioides]